MFALLKTLAIILQFDIASWQHSIQDFLKNKTQSFPSTSIHALDKYSLNFFSSVTSPDPGEKYYYVLHDLISMPTWLFVMRYKNQHMDELWHRDTHNGIPCNVIIGNKILLHIKTVGLISANIIFMVNVEVKNTNNGVVAIINLDKSYPSEDVYEFKMILWSYPASKNIVITVAQGYIKSPYPVTIIENKIKWQIDNMLLNFTERLVAVTK